MTPTTTCRDWSAAILLLERAQKHLYNDVNPKELASNKALAEMAAGTFKQLGDSYYWDEALALCARYDVRHAELLAAQMMRQTADRLEQLAQRTARPPNQQPIDRAVTETVGALRMAVERLIGVES
jgi:hypothetical protein